MTRSEESNFMKKQITLGELLAASFVVVGVVLTFWINTNVRLAVLELEYLTLKGAIETQSVQYKNDNNKLFNKMDDLQKGQQDIQLSLKDKENRK